MDYLLKTLGLGYGGLSPKKEREEEKGWLDSQIKKLKARSVASMEDQKPTEDVKLQAGLEEEDSSDSSCMVPSVQKDVPASDEKSMFRTPRKKTFKQVAYDDSQTSKRGKRKSEILDSEAHSSALKRGKELQTELSSEHPSFIKQMQRSHVVYKFVMGVPLEFRQLHLPIHEVRVVLEDENGESYKTKYVPTEGKFVTGWKKFSVAHNLLESDVVVFHLLKPLHFKVYIIRANDPTVVGSSNHTNKGKKKIKCEAVDVESPELAPHPDTVQESVKKAPLLSDPCIKPGLDHSRSEEFESPDAEASPSSGCDADTENITDVADDKCETSKRSCMPKGGRSYPEAHALALERATELQTNLSSEHPSFVKRMLRTNVTPKPILIIPGEFNKVHLPKHDTKFTLEDEGGERYVIKFLANGRGRFMGGWKRFAAEQKLLEGDVGVFHLVKPCYFKVYIVRVNDPSAVGSTNLSSSNVHANEDSSVKKKQRKCEAAGSKSPGMDTVPASVKRTPLLSNLSLQPGSDHSSTKEFQSSDMGASSLTGRCADFENFKIVVNDKAVDPELSRSTRFKYYQLCCSRETYLHARLLKNMDPALAAAIITGTLKVADDIRASKLSTSTDDFAMWERTLDGFESFGMNVGFMRDRLRRLTGLAAKFREMEEVKKYLEAKSRRNGIREEMKSIEQKYLEMKRAADGLGDDMKNMKESIKKSKDSFQDEASAPW